MTHKANLLVVDLIVMAESILKLVYNGRKFSDIALLL
jgi:hypothetical protein